MGVFGLSQGRRQPCGQTGGIAAGGGDKHAVGGGCRGQSVKADEIEGTGLGRRPGRQGMEKQLQRPRGGDAGQD